MADTTREALAAALRRAFNLGQTYWQQADSDSAAQHRKSDETRRKFEALVAETVAATPEQAPAVQARPYCAKLAGPCPDNCPAVEVSGCGLTRMRGDCWRVKPPPFTLPPTDAERRAALATGALPLMQAAFRTTVVEDGRYTMRFQFRSIDDMHAADLEWHAWRSLATTPAVQAEQPAGVVAWCALTPSGQIAYFDGKPMVMPGPVGNEHHPVPLYASPRGQAEDAQRLDADMFWDNADGERFGHDIDEIVAEYDLGSVVKIDCARRTPSITVRVIEGDYGENTWEPFDAARASDARKGEAS
jgi:hypothetical protein